MFSCFLNLNLGEENHRSLSFDAAIPGYGFFGFVFTAKFFSPVQIGMQCMFSTKHLKKEGNSVVLLSCLVGALLTAQKCMQVCD